MALRTRRISFILHLSEVRLTTRPVISMDMDGLRCIPIDHIGFHSTNRYRRIQSDNISALSDFHLTSGTFFASNVSYFPFGRCYEQNFANSIGKLRFPLVCIGNVRQKVNIYPFFSFSFLFFVTTWVKEKQHRKLGKGNEIRNNRDMISGEVQKRDLKIIDKSCPSQEYLK